MKNKIFSIKKEEYRYVINIFGIKLKINSLKLAIKSIKSMQLQLRRSKIPTIYLADLTMEQKIWYLSQKFYEEVGYYPNFKNPKSFNEKINWLKLNYYNPIEEICIDKYAMKEYIKDKLGVEYVIPAIGVWDDVNDIDFDKLPNRFVIKVTTSGSGEGVEVVKDKSKLNIDKLKYKFNNLLQEWNTIYYYCFSRGYKNIKPRIIIEEYVEQLTQNDCDYKFLCFNGEVKYFYITNNKVLGKERTVTYYNMDLNRLPCTYYGYKITGPQKLKKTQSFDNMIEIAKKLSADFPFVRVDFYVLDNKLYIGEMTFTPGGGFGPYYPVEWDYKIGESLDLSKINPKYLNSASAQEFLNLK